MSPPEWAVGGALLGLMRWAHEYGAGRCSRRDVILYVLIFAVGAILLRDLLAANWASDSPPQDHFG